MFIFPAHRFNPDPVKAGLSERVITGGESLSGDTDVISTDGGGRWEITYAGMALDDPDLQRLWEQWTSHMGGGVTPILVPILALDTAPRPVAGSAPARPSDLYADDDAFPTAVHFAAPYIAAHLAADAALRATSLSILITQGARILGGEQFSLANRAHKIERVTARSGMQATCIISPPLRAAATSGDAVNFEWPVVQCRLATGQDLTPERAWDGSSTVSASFVEDFTSGG